MKHVTRAAQQAFSEKDLHGDVRYAFNSSCTKIADYTYDAWGNDATSSTSTWAQNNPVRYNGQYFDAETGMYYLRARYYDPNMNRFISEDPHWNVDNMIYGDSGEVPSVASIMQSNNLQ